jgi:hypothetical protein
MKETAVVFITLLLLLTIISIFGGAIKPAQQQQSTQRPFILNASEGYEDGDPEEEKDDVETYEANVENVEEEKEGDDVMPFVSEEFASF